LGIRAGLASFRFPILTAAKRVARRHACLNVFALISASRKDEPIAVKNAVEISIFGRPLDQQEPSLLSTCPAEVGISYLI